MVCDGTTKQVSPVRISIALRLAHGSAVVMRTQQHAVEATANHEQDYSFAREAPSGWRIRFLGEPATIVGLKRATEWGPCPLVCDILFEPPDVPRSFHTSVSRSDTGASRSSATRNGRSKARWQCRRWSIDRRQIGGLLAAC